MVLYLGCQTGAQHTSGYNLVDVTFDKGVHFVLGVTEIIYNFIIKEIPTNILSNIS